LIVVHIVRQFSPSVGGLETSVLNLARSQREILGIDARVVTLDRVFGGTETLRAEDNVSGVPVRRLRWRGSQRYPLAPSVLRHLQSADVIHVHAIDFFFDFLAVTRPFHGCAMIASTHGGFFHSPQLSILKRIWFATVTRLSIQAYRRIVACSHSDADLFRSRAGRRLVTIENGIDQARFADASAARQTRTIICFGRFARHKRIAELFPLLARLRALDPVWRLILAGRDADQTEAELRAIAGDAGVGDAVTFVANPSDAALKALIGEASYAASLSSYEGFGLAAVEAMSAGLLPILSGIVPFRRLVDESGMGLIVNADDPAGAAAMVAATVLADPAAYTERRRRIMESVRRYNWDSVATQYAGLYEEAAAARRDMPAAARLETGT